MRECLPFLLSKPPSEEGKSFLPQHHEMERCRSMLSNLRGSANRRQHSKDASSETLLAEQDPCEDEKEETEEMCTDRHGKRRRKVLLQIGLGCWIIISFCCVFYIIFSLTIGINTKHSFPNPNTNNTLPTTDMKLQIIIPSFVSLPRSSQNLYR